MAVWTLRFDTHEMEKGFIHTRRPSLIRRYMWLLWIHLFANAASLLLNFTSRSEPYSDMEQWAVTFQSMCQASMMFLDVLWLALLCKGSKRVMKSQCRTPVLEIAMIAFMAFSMVVAVWSSSTAQAKLRGYTLKEAFGEDAYDSDSTILLTIDGIITAAHVGLPARWFILFPLQVTALAAYVLVVSTVGSEEPLNHIIFNMIVLTCLVAAASMGKRSAELDERKAFLENIREKSLRCEAEYQLEKVRTMARGDAMSGATSDHTTTKSARVFDALFEKGEDRRVQLQRLAEMGDSEHWRIAASEVSLLPEDALGSGGFGMIRRAIFCGMVVAVKCPHVELEAVKVADLCNELRVLRHLRHPNIVTAHGACILPHEQQIFLVLELIDGVNLTAYLTRSDGDDPGRLPRYQIMLGVCRALLYMHTRMPPIVHGDLKGNNIMVEMCKDYAHPKVLDFGLSRIISGRSRALGGTLPWIAPEVLADAPVRCSADVYSLGRVLAFTATGILPMRNMKYSLILRSLLKRKPPQPTWPEGCAFAPLCMSLVKSCIQADPLKRPTVTHLHQFLLGLPDELGLPSEGTFLEQVRLVAEETGANVVRDSSMDYAVSLKGSVVSKLPSLPEEEVLGVASIETSHSAASRPTRRIPFPKLQETSRQALESSLLVTFKRWNACRPGKSCCERHAWFQLCQEICGRAMTTGCVAGPMHKNLAPVQCSNCGVLFLDGAETCDLCGFDMVCPSETSSADGHLHKMEL